MATQAVKTTYRSNTIMAGIFYIVATVAPISTIFFVGFLGGQIAIEEPIQDYLTHVFANETQVVLGMFVEFVYTLAIVGIIVNLTPILKKHSEVSAHWFYSLRFIEAICAVIGSIILLTLLPLSQQFVQTVAADAHFVQILGDVLLAARDWVFLIGSGLVWSLSALVLNYALYQSRLVPWWLSVWGFFGAILSLAAYVSQFFGFTPLEILWLPIAVQEMVFAVWLIFKGIDLSGTSSDTA
ncbi:DUF4386 domain-containing protein [Chloroflexota bacterium]